MLKNKTVRLVVMLILILFAFLFSKVWIYPAKMGSSSMEPTISKNSIVFIDRYGYAFGPPQKGQIVLYRPLTNASHLPWGTGPGVHRVVAAPGDEITVSGKTMRINDGDSIVFPLKAISMIDSENTVKDGETYRLKSSEYLVMGDNTSNSIALIIKIDNIQGKVLK